jgi:predicted nucleic-acid-binding Zn-ribbon protein
MNTPNCPKCGGEMDQGTVSVTESPKYVSNRQKGILKVVTPVNRAQVCLACGYVELYLDAEVLKKKI